MMNIVEKSGCKVFNKFNCGLIFRAGPERRNQGAKMIYLQYRRNITTVTKTSVLNYLCYVM